MRPSLAVKTFTAAFIVLVSSASFVGAETATPATLSQAALDEMANKARTEAINQVAAAQAASNKALAAPVITDAPKSLFNQSSQQGMTEKEWAEEVKKKDSPAYKANALAQKAKASGELVRSAEQRKVENDLDLLYNQSPPPDMPALQKIKETNGGYESIADDSVVDKEIALDMRRDAQKEAALSYGARGGLAKRAYQIMESIEGHGSALDRVFDFRQLLVKAPSGLLIEPPIVSESLAAVVISDGGNEAAVADQVLKINKQAKIVTAPRDWRHYLLMSYASEIPPPPKVLWPKTPDEQLEWNAWVKKGWDAGFAQGEDIFDMNLNKLMADYKGMVRYRTLLAEGKISQPFALQEDRGVTGGKGEMRVGDRALRITGPSEFVTGTNIWQPATR